MPAKAKKDQPSQPSAAGAFVGAGCCALFGLPFAGFALFMAWKLIAMALLAHEAAGWQTVGATLDRVKLVEHSTGEGGHTYEVEAEYRYTFEGEEHASDSVGLSDEADDVESYHRKLYERLESARKDGRAVDCYVDPGDPTRSLLVREFRPITLAFFLPFVLGFGVVGFGLFYGAVYVARSGARQAKLSRAAPEQPWLWRDDWKTGVVHSSNKAGAIAVGLFALLWNSISLPIAVVALAGGDKEIPWWAYPLLMLFPLFGLALLIGFVYLLMRWRKYGESQLRMASVPGVVGGQLAGVVVAPRAIAEAERIKAKLACLQTVDTGDGSREETVWSDERTISRTLDAERPDRVGVPIVFTIPSGAKPTNDKKQIAWKLSLAAKVPGVDYDAQFDVPVFRTKDSRPDVEVTSDTLSAFEEDRPLEQLLAEQRLLVEPLGAIDSVRYVSPRGRFRGAAIFCTLFTVGLSAASVGLFANGHWLGGGVFALFALLLFYASVDLWLGRSELTITRGEWSAANGWSGPGGRAVRFAPDEIRSISTGRSMSSGSGSSQKVWRHVEAELANGQSVVLVRNVRSGPGERKLLEDLRRRAGLDDKSHQGEQESD